MSKKNLQAKQEIDTLRTIYKDILKMEYINDRSKEMALEELIEVLKDMMEERKRSAERLSEVTYAIKTLLALGSPAKMLYASTDNDPALAERLQKRSRGYGDAGY